MKKIEYNRNIGVTYYRQILRFIKKENPQILL